MRRMTESRRRGAYRIGYGWGQENLEAFKKFIYRDCGITCLPESLPGGVWTVEAMHSLLRGWEAGDLLQCGFYDGRHDHPYRDLQGDSL